MFSMDRIKQEVFSRVDLYDVVAEEFPELRDTKMRAAHFRMPCCFHNGDDDNLKVSPDSFFCFVCKERGDAIDWLEKRQGLEFMDALKYLARLGGLDVDRLFGQGRRRVRRLSPQEQRRQVLREALGKIRNYALEYAGERFPNFKRLRVPSLGYLPPFDEVRSRLLSDGVGEDVLEEIGLTSESLAGTQWDSGGGVVWAGDGQVYAIRPFGDPDAPVIGVRGSRSSGWVGLERAVRPARMSGHLLVAADGRTYWSLSVGQVPAAVLPIGRANAAVLERRKLLSITPVVIAAPNNRSRQRAQSIAMELIADYPRLLVGEIDLSQVPYVEQERAVESLLDEAGTFFDWQAEHLKRSFLLDTEKGRRRAAWLLARIVARIDRGTHPVEREVYRAEMERLTGYAYKEILEQAKIRRSVTKPSVAMAR